MLVQALILSTLLLPQKPIEKWTLRTNLNGKYVEIYDVYKGNQKVGTGLREIVERHNYYMPDREKKYAEILKPEYDLIRIAQGRFVLALKPNDKAHKVWIASSEVQRDRVKVGKLTETPYVDLYGGVNSWFTGGNGVPETIKAADSAKYVFGIRRNEYTGITPSIEYLAKLHQGYQSGMVMDLDVMDRDLNVKFTVNNLRVLPSRYGSAWRIQIDTSTYAPLNMFLNDDGEPISPSIPLVREFSNGIVAIPTSLEFKRYVPIPRDGRMKIETMPTAGYYPDYAISDDGWYGYNFQGWIKEYITSQGSLYGWSSLDLDKETGPLWRSIQWFDNTSINREAPTRSIIGQLADGRWMMYSLSSVTDGSMPHQPYFETPFATHQELIDAYRPVYNKQVEPEILRRREAARVEAIRYAQAYEEMTKYLEIDPGLSAGSMSMADLRSHLYRTVTSLNARLYDDFDKAYRSLPGDYFLKYLAIAHGMRRVSLSPESARSYSASAVAPRIKQMFLDIATEIERQDAEKKKRDAEAKKAREAGYNDPNKFKARPPLSGPGWTSSWSDPYAKPSYSEASKRHEQYMSDMWKYLGGQQAWRPYN